MLMPCQLTQIQPLLKIPLDPSLIVEPAVGAKLIIGVKPAIPVKLDAGAKPAVPIEPDTRAVLAVPFEPIAAVEPTEGA